MIEVIERIKKRINEKYEAIRLDSKRCYDIVNLNEAQNRMMGLRYALEIIDEESAKEPQDTYKKLYEDLKTEHLDMIKQISKETQVQPIANQWIPCSERLPEQGQEVICCNFEGIIEIGYLHYRVPHILCCEHGPLLVEDVIAWMPLPEPYKKEV